MPYELQTLCNRYIDNCQTLAYLCVQCFCHPYDKGSVNGALLLFALAFQHFMALNAANVYLLTRCFQICVYHCILYTPHLHLSNSFAK